MDRINHQKPSLAPIEASSGKLNRWQPKPLVLKIVSVLGRPDILLLLVLLIGLSIPTLTFLLPACRDHIDEIYQPLQALKFFKSRGHTYHKYAPLPNFILAPGYGMSLVYWKLSGSLDTPVEDFPYGFKRPFEQMGFLILQGRIIFLVLGLFSFAYLARALEMIIPNQLAIAAAMVFCIATNCPLLHALPTPRPDSPMLSLCALALAFYIHIIHQGLTLRRAVALVVFTVLAASCKELGGLMFVIPTIAVLLVGGGDGGWWERSKTIAAAGTIGVALYLLLNVVYAPTIWLERMRFWVLGAGLDPSVWGGGGNTFITAALACTVDNLGPAGTIVAIGAVGFSLFFLPKRAFLLSLPLISVFGLGVSRIRYPADRFYTVVALGLVPLVALGIGCICDCIKTSRLRTAFIATLILGAVINLWYATFSWHSLHGTFEYLVETDVVAHANAQDNIYLLDPFPRNKGSSRLERMGYSQDARPLQKLIEDPSNRPTRIYVSKGYLRFLLESQSLPARAKMIRDESGFDPIAWGGLEAMGYELSGELAPRTPWWFPFDWMYSVKEWKSLSPVLIYRLKQ